MRGGKELWIARAHHQLRVLEQPRRKPAKLPLRTGVRSGTKDDVKPFLLRLANKLGNIKISGKVEDSRTRLVRVPEDVRRHGIQAHGFGHAQPIAPVSARD